MAIVNDTYHWVLLELEEQRNKLVVSDVFKEGYNNVLDRVLSRERAMAIEEAVNIAEADGEVTYEEIRQNLKKYFLLAIDLLPEGQSAMDKALTCHAGRQGLNLYMTIDF